MTAPSEQPSTTNPLLVVIFVLLLILVILVGAVLIVPALRRYTAPLTRQLSTLNERWTTLQDELRTPFA